MILRLQLYLSSKQSACALLYRHLWPVWLYHISQHYLHKRQYSRRKNYRTKNVFRFSLQILSEIFLILSRIQRDIIVN